MPTKLTADDARQSLNSHVAVKGAEIFAKYGPALGWPELQRLMADRVCARYPCEIAFDSEPLEAGECAHPLPQGDRPEDGFRVCVHPFFRTRLDDVPVVALYQMVLVNYGEFATPDDAETFGAGALGLTKDEYYRRLCELADELAADQAARHSRGWRGRHSSWARHGRPSRRRPSGSGAGGRCSVSAVQGTWRARTSALQELGD